MYKYHCEVNKQDTLVAYETLDEMPNKAFFALVAENRNRAMKVSVLLSVDDAVLLKGQLDEFIKEYSTLH